MAQEWNSVDAKLEEDLKLEMEDPAQVAQDQHLKLQRQQILEAIHQVCTQIHDNF